MAERTLQEERRRQILLAAAEVFARYGYYETKVEDVALAAGIGKGTVYEYFRSKQELFLAMLSYVGEEHLKRLRAGLAGRPNAREKLVALAESHLGLLKEYRDLARLIFYSHAVLGRTVWDWMEQQERALVGLIAEVLREGIKAGEFRQVGELFAARVFAGALWSAGASLIWPGGGAKDYPGSEELARQVVDLFTRGIAKS